MQKNNDALKRWMQLNEAMNLYNTVRVGMEDSDFPEYENSNVENIQSDVISSIDEDDKE
ncbi:Uncharacterised protein [Haemophilus pittmaniae]|jgi:hypothetical protein|uniref:Uncharacterized protein n=1 Tax=Haemophilus pittmaniae TaxID=249188 RepID=A0A377IWR7_9PAST|nr:hypothetical protein [Haemophilus pittmaniae]STO92398.1 Uncharacterised protein [Haemophilus pittmaniae]